MKLKTLIIDDEKTILQTFKLRLAKWGYDILLASNGVQGLKILSENECHVVITDLKMPGISGRELVQRIHEHHPKTEIVVITGYATVESAVDVMKSGACDLIVKPLNFDHVRIVLEKIADRIALQEENLKLQGFVGELRNEVEKKYRMGNLIGKSRAIHAVFDQIRKVAPLDSTVMIYGETGTGKEMVAKAIHHNSPRKSGPMVVVDCGSLAETLLESELFGHVKGAFTGAEETKHGRFETAREGTIFLDEVGNASPMVQKKLLRIIEEKTFHRVGGSDMMHTDVRIVAAANQNLLDLVNKNKFRKDLYYRLNVFPIHLPLLKDRKEDVSLLARYFIDRVTKRMEISPLDISPNAMEELVAYDWPGNIRELFNVIERTVIITTGSTINRFFIKDDSSLVMTHDTLVKLDTPLKDQIADLEYNYLKHALETNQGRLKKVIKCSGLNPRTLYRKMKLYGLDKKDF
jgi:DNA-binding NtrC family response regulator